MLMIVHLILFCANNICLISIDVYPKPIYSYSSLATNTWGEMAPVNAESTVFKVSNEDFPALPPKNKHLGEGFCAGKQLDD